MREEERTRKQEGKEEGEREEALGGQGKENSREWEGEARYIGHLMANSHDIWATCRPYGGRWPNISC